MCQALCEEDKVDTVVQRWSKLMETHGKGPTLWPVITRFELSTLMIPAGLSKLMGDVCGYYAPLSVPGLIAYVRSVKEGNPIIWLGIGSGYWLAAGLLITSVLQSILLHHHHHLVIRAGMHARTAV